MTGERELIDLARRLSRIVMVGTVEEVTAKPPRARVRIGDAVTAPLLWVNARAGDTRTWDPPSIGEQVLLLSPSGRTEQGVVVAGIYGPDGEANGSSLTEARTDYPDGSWETHDEEAGDRGLKITGNATISVDGDVTVITKGNATVQADGNVEAEAGGDVLATAGGKAVVDAPAIELGGTDGEVVTTAHPCAYTGSSHMKGSSIVKAGG
ncbi:phage baseplate assembly protein V [Thiohalospira halophila DSM 15071]|uniref:Phage baseplate assembly protein V n=1 Tax=Thiohalospira halophila DSM 15071 TaxID=1123397 RepID=A0A1I1UBL3_9GAMM|nr:phage baseplate assembly protein V [Thiohalospira halophila]SFD68025.1 phage baseplate assembly protein V [Thiohalospira halophila DSM 15071]